MPSIDIDEIVVPEDRIRKDFKEGAMLTLCESIWRIGLLHPPVLRDDCKTLIAGERRTKALRLLIESKELRDKFTAEFGEAKPEVNLMIKTKQVPYHTGSEWLNDSELLEAELFENIHRDDITWQERHRALARLHEMRGGSMDRRAGNRDPGGQTIKKTAAEAFQTEEPSPAQQKQVATALDLAQYLDDPLVAAAPDEKTAAKIVQSIRAAKARKDAADALEGKQLDHTVIHADVYDLLKDKDPRVMNMDIIICDPPYGRDMNKHGFENRHEYDDSRSVFDRFCDEGLPLLYSTAAAARAHCYVFCDITDVERVQLSAVAGGWDVWRWPLIWDKGNVGTYGNAKQGPRHCYDAVVYLWKGGMQPVAMFRDVIPINQQQGLAHPAGKPVAVYMDLLKRSAVAGMRAFDPMVGGGTFFDACKEAKLLGTGVEQMEQYYHMAIERVAELTGA